ncbi:hypothetical protein Ancab_004188 [Ancistrocladus abbreviatus]
MAEAEARVYDNFSISTNKQLVSRVLQFGLVGVDKEIKVSLKYERMSDCGMFGHNGNKVEDVDELLLNEMKKQCLSLGESNHSVEVPSKFHQSSRKKKKAGVPIRNKAIRGYIQRLRQRTNMGNCFMVGNGVQSGGLALFWNGTANINVVIQTDQLLLYKVHQDDVQNCWWLAGVYRAPNFPNKMIFWDALEAFLRATTDLVVLISDWNAIISQT